MTLLFEGGITVEVVPERIIGLLGCQLGADSESAEIVGHIRHAGIFPINEAEMIVFVNEKVEGKEVVVAGSGRKPIGVRIPLEFKYSFSRSSQIPGDLNVAMFAQQLVTQTSLNEIEAAREFRRCHGACGPYASLV